MLCYAMLCYVEALPKRIADILIANRSRVTGDSSAWHGMASSWHGMASSWHGVASS